MFPVFHIRANGEDITKKVNDRLIALTVEDSKGKLNPSLSVSIDDRAPSFAFPPADATLEVFMGYAQVQGHAVPYQGVKHMGIFMLDEITASKGAGGRTMSFTGHAVATHAKYKQTRNQLYTDTYVKDIVETCASRSGLEPKVHPSFGDIFLFAINQRNQSDIDFIENLANRYDADSKPANGKLYFAPTDKMAEWLATDGNTFLSDVLLDESDCEEWQYGQQGRGKFTAVRAMVYDKDQPEKATTVESYKTESLYENYLDLHESYPTVAEAQAAVDARKRALDYGVQNLTATCVGNPQLMGGTSIILSNFREGIPTEWRIIEAAHTFAGGGYRTSFKAELKDATGGGSEGDDSSEE